jgi:hypothetical protein
MSYAAQMLFHHGYIATPAALASALPAAAPAHAGAAAPGHDALVAAVEAAPRGVHAPWRRGPFLLVAALCDTGLPEQFRIA